MVNVTNGQLVFLKFGVELHQEVRKAMERVAKTLLKMHNLESLDLSTVTTKTNAPASYPKFILRHVLLQEMTFDEKYVECVWQLYQSNIEDVTPEQFYAVTLSEPHTEFAFKRTYVHRLKRGLGLFLVALHSCGAITLPMRFDWPSGLAKLGPMSQDFGIFSELLNFVRVLEAKTEELPHPAFMSVGINQKRREWFLCYGTKLLLATGWLVPQDARIADLLTIKEAESQLGVAGEVLAYKALIDVLRERYGSDFDITVDDWSTELQNFITLGNITGGLSSQTESGLLNSRKNKGRARFNLEVADKDLLSEIVKATPAMASAMALRARPRLPGLSADLVKLTSTWLDLQDVYKKTVKREGYKQVDLALGHLNIYLFFYLAYWCQRRPDTLFEFPDQPRKLIASVFVSRLLTQETVEMPVTFIEYMNEVHLIRRWKNEHLYGILKQLEVFFEFLELHGDELPGCIGFRQPIPEYAYPPVSRSKGTNKRPIPRRVFGVFLDYVEALKAHLEVILEKAVSGNLDCNELARHIDSRSTTIIDTFAISSLVGFIPIIFTRNGVIPLRYIPNCLCLDWFPVKGGRRLKLPQPHALNQILVALYTGLRHNHVQWLDAGTFDAEVPDEVRDFALLLVNTDKSMVKPWTPHVNFRVIEILRDQRKWRGLIELPGFGEKHYYNDNPNTKWPPILPLFSSSVDGLPHSDSRYIDVWSDIICAIDGLLPSLGESLQQLSALEPPGVSINDPAARSKKQAYGADCKRVCELLVKSRISPHSSRVSVVSQYATLLPAEVIGARFTGQKTGTVYHYVVIDPEDLQNEKIHQAMQLREKAYRNAGETWGVAGPSSKQYIRADSINSNLSRSLRTNLQETLVSYGCISITMNEGATSGLDVLRETRAANAAENKTDICPYGNHCPPEVIKQWRGTRRCGLCQYAVRSVDHLPAVSAKVKEFDEMLHELTVKVEAALGAKPPPYTEEELDRLDDERSRLAEELTGWRLNEEVLDAARIRIAKGQDDRRWVVQKPEVILQDLQRVPVPSNLTAYVLARLGECIAYPASESPQIRARFDVLRRNVLARTGQYQKAFDMAVPADPARECAGLLRSVVEANKLSYDDIVNLLEGNGHLEGLSLTSNQLLLDVDAS